MYFLLYPIRAFEVQVINFPQYFPFPKKIISNYEHVIFVIESIKHV